MAKGTVRVKTPKYKVSKKSNEILEAGTKKFAQALKNLAKK